MSKIKQLKIILSTTPLRWIRFYFFRSIKDSILNKIVQKFLQIPEKKVGVISGENNLDTLNEKGILFLDKQLSNDQINSAREYLENNEVFDPRFSDEKFLPFSDNRRRDCHIAHYPPEIILNTPHLLNISNDPKVLNIVKNFLGFEPIIGYMSCWWSYPTEGPPKDAENYHRDYDDIKFIKYFMYLTEVNDENGPHIFVQKSANKSVGKEITRYDDKFIKSEFGEENIIKIIGKKGTSFLEDTTGFHKGLPPKNKMRLIFQVTYSKYILPYAPSKPFVINSDKKLDKRLNKAYIA